MDYYQHTFSNYEYDVDSSGRDEVWTCRRNDDYKTKTNLPGSVTEVRLVSWKHLVNEINDGELQLIWDVGQIVASVAITQFFTGGLATAIAHLEGSAQAIVTIPGLSTSWNEADDVFDSI